MAVLKYGLLGAALLGGCALVNALRPGERELSFSHRVHVLDQGMGCAACHEDAWGEERPGWPWQDTCLACHDGIDAESPEERRIEVAFPIDAEGRLLFEAHGRLSDEVVFSHLAHIDAGVDCASCHVGIDAAERVGPELGVNMAACMSCHEEREQPNECATCHTEIDVNWLPPNHTHDWERLHGHASRLCAGDLPSECSTCHTERSCADCHLVTPPKSHDHTFRTRTHGFLASLDRDSCSTCHESDSCAQCHFSTTPRSHSSPTFGGSVSTHCLGCHLPVEDNGCNVCHAGTPSHALASPKPDWHHPAMNCRQCHGVTAPLPHVEKGDDCNACHH
ncbi:MAG: hypothetical protein O2816_07790 [Planctomycetota bacterium]|nr:hypothetical protein [Planctomycetota bacterium]